MSAYSYWKNLRKGNDLKVGAHPFSYDFYHITLSMK